VFSFAVQVLKRPLLVLPARSGPITAEEGDVDIDLKDRLGRLGLCACVTLTLFLSSSQNYSPTGIPEQISIVALVDVAETLVNFLARQDQVRILQHDKWLIA
jgi:hypothetical protein